jgi:hypothetical protein
VTRKPNVFFRIIDLRGSHLLISGRCCVDGLLAVGWLSCIDRLLAILWLELDGLGFIRNTVCIRIVGQAVTSCFAVTVEIDRGKDEGDDEEDAVIC